MTRRVVRALDLVDDERLIAEYRRWHASGAVWPEVLKFIRESGIVSMEIWGVTNRLVMVMEVTDDFPRAVAQPPRVQEWEQLVSVYQRLIPNAPAGEKWAECSRVFAIDAADAFE
jgi:L-rhamnose mutarotase